MNQNIYAVIGGLMGLGLSSMSLAAQPIFLVTPNTAGPAQLATGQTGTAIYLVQNTSGRTLTNIGLINVPAGVTQVASAGNQYCSSLFTMAPGDYCMLKLQMSSTVNMTIQGGPKLCFSQNNPVYCSQPLQENQLATQVMASLVSSSCQGNINNFNYELSQALDASPFDNYWGPSRNHLPLSPTNPNLSSCGTTDITNTANINWMRQRVIAAENFWVNQKLNYCHHHVPDWQTPAVILGTPRSQLTTGEGGYCSPAVDINPNTPYYNQAVRWNYSGTGSETSNNWINNNVMWYGMDCSDFTSFIYNFAFGIQFNSDTGYQAGQAQDGSQDNVFPNAQTALNTLQAYDNTNPDSPAGVLVCADGTTEAENPQCGGYGTNGYFSQFLYPNAHPSHPDPTPGTITPLMLTYLKPGDLIYLGFAGNDGNNPTSMVTHVVTWTGQKVGYGANDINPNLIAPESICPNNWQPSIGDWVIIDSHYQGPDYRVFTPCFYENNVWGVRRIIGYMM